MVSRLFLIAVLTAVMVTSVAVMGIDSSSNNQQSADAKGCKPGSKADIQSHGKCVKPDVKPPKPVTNSTTTKTKTAAAY